MTIVLCRQQISIRTGLTLNTLIALSVLVHVEVLLVIHPGHEPPKLLLPLLVPIMAMCLPLRPRELIPTSVTLLLVHLAFAPLTKPAFITIELILLGISIFFGFLSVHLGDRDRRELAASQAAITREQTLLKESNITLEERVAERTIELKALGLELNRAEQRERQNLARTLHDDLQQVLAAVRLRLAAITVSDESSPPSETTAHLDAAQDLLLEALDTARTLSVELAPYALLDHGLTSALDWLARQLGERYDLEVSTELDDEANPADDDVATFLFRAARELLFNVVKHADTASAQLKLSLSKTGRPTLRVSDSGQGTHEVDRILNRSGELPTTFGLPTMARRVQLMDGKMTVETAASSGFSVVIELPNEL